MNIKTLLTTGLALTGLATFAAVDTSAFAKKMTITASDTFTNGVADKLAKNESGETTESIANFPVLVRLDATKVSYADFLQTNGGDMMFVQGEGADAVQLPYEVQTWNPAGESFVWVKVPTLAAGTTFDLYYSTIETIENNPTDVWSEYVSVLHYEEPKTGETTLANMANRSLDATAKGASSYQVAGVLGGARDNRTEGCGIELGATPSGFGISGTFTFSTWLIHEGAYYWDGIVYSGDKFAGLGDAGGFGVQLNNNTKELMSIASGNYNDYDLCKINFDGDWNGGWKYFAISYNDMDATLNNNSGVYINAMLEADYKESRSNWGDKINPSKRKITIGCRGDFGGTKWQGSFDESRLRKCVSTEAWLTAERLSIAADAMTYGEVETLIESSITFAEGAAVVRNDDGTVTVTAELAEGAAAKLEAVFNGTEVLLMATDVKSGVPVSKTFAADALPADKTWTVLLRATDAQGAVSGAEVAGVFMTGAVSVSPLVETADEGTCSVGSFKVTRPVSAAQHPLDVALTIGGSAVNGQTYASVPVNFTFAIGESEKVFEVKPLRDLAIDRESVATFTVAPGQYATDDSSASVTIVNFRDPEIAKFSKLMPLTLKADVDAFIDGKPVANIPVLVRLKKGDNGFDPADVLRDDHADLAFYSADFTALPYEIESWDPDGESCVWVKVPELTTDLTLNMLYGSTEAANNTSTDVWTAYDGVWHLTETEGTRRDSSANKMDGEVVNGRVLITDPSNTIFQKGTREVSASLWVKPSKIHTWEWLIGSCQVEKDGRWGLQFTSSEKIRFWNDGGKEPQIATPAGAVAADQWVHFTFVYDGGSDYLYVNGALVGTLSDQSWANGQNRVGNQIAIGGLVDTGSTSCLTSAEFKEVRYYGGVLSAEWAKATYAFDTADCFDAGEVRDLAGSNAVMVDYVTTTLVEGVPTLVFPLKGGTGSVAAVITKPDGTTETRVLAEEVTGPQNVYLPISEVGPAGWYDVGIRAESADGDYDKRDASVRVCTAPVWVKPGAKGASDGTAAKFFIGREGDESVLAEALAVKCLVNGVEQTVTIPAGVAVVQIEVPGAEGATSATVTLVCDSAAIATDRASATVEIVQGAVKPRVFRFVVNDYTGGEVADFPALVRLNEGIGGFSYDLVREWATGADLRFTLGDQKTVLAHEIDVWDPAGESTIWVKLPKLAKGKEILMQVGGVVAEVADEVKPHTVWGDQVSVYHLNYGKEGSLEGHGYYGNSAYAARNTMRGWDSGNLTHLAGIVGEGQRISTGTEQQSDGRYIRMGANAIMANLTSTFTASFWMKYGVAGQHTGDDRLLSHKGEWNATGWEITLSRSGEKYLEARGADGTTFKQEVFADGANSGDWYHVVVAFDETNVRYYLNGALVSEGEGVIKAADNSASRTLTIGNGNNQNYSSFKGTMDEVRLATGNLTAARIKADYETVANANFFRMKEYKPGFVVFIQ